MTLETFYSIYIPALEKALEQDDVNHGFYVKGPEHFIGEKPAAEIELFMDENPNDFIDKVAYYFDAKSHNFPSIGNTPIEDYRRELLNEVTRIKIEYAIRLHR